MVQAVRLALHYGEENLKLEGCFNSVISFLKKQDSVSDEFIDIDDYEVILIL